MRGDNPSLTDVRGSVIFPKTLSSTQATPEDAMNWEAPAFEEINMSAEIGGYQGDSDGGNQPPAAEQTNRDAAQD
jgi:hypothetical protein